MIPAVSLALSFESCSACSDWITWCHEQQHGSRDATLYFTALGDVTRPLPLHGSRRHSILSNCDRCCRLNGAGHKSVIYVERPLTLFRAWELHGVCAQARNALWKALCEPGPRLITTLVGACCHICNTLMRSSSSVGLRWQVRVSPLCLSTECMCRCEVRTPPCVHSLLFSLFVGLLVHTDCSGPSCFVWPISGWSVL